MNSLNSVLIEGNLTADPERKELESGAVTVTFQVAANRYYMKDNEKAQEVSYFDIEVWNKTAELCAKMLTKGRGVRVIGRMKQYRWNDADGKSRSRVMIVGENVEFKSKFDRKPSDIPEED